MPRSPLDLPEEFERRHPHVAVAVYVAQGLFSLALAVALVLAVYFLLIWTTS